MTSPIHPVAWLLEQWQEFLAEASQPRYRATQVFRWIHARGIMSPDDMSDLPKPLRAALADAGLDSPLTVATTHESSDGARKLVLAAKDGAVVETVLLPDTAPGAAEDANSGAADEAAPYDSDEAGVDRDWDDEPHDPSVPADALAPPLVQRPHIRVTQCISTQVGCAMGCVHCASGKAGLVRQLGPEEILAQVLVGIRSLKEGERLGNVLFMGMGEPLHNFAATARTIRLLMHPEGQGLGPRRITVSTAGLVPGIDRLGEEFGGRIGLAVSLHGGRDRTRSAIAPIGRRYPLTELVASLLRYRLPTRRRITIEYTLIAGHNDSPQEATALARLLRDVRVKVNLIPLNPIAHSDLVPSSPEAVAAFQRTLIDAGMLCFVRRRRGDDVSAACGQLAAGLSEADIERKRVQDLEREMPAAPRWPRADSARTEPSARRAGDSPPLAASRGERAGRTGQAKPARSRSRRAQPNQATRAPEAENRTQRAPSKSPSDGGRRKPRPGSGTGGGTRPQPATPKGGPDRRRRRG